MSNPTILSAALFEREERVLTAHRKPGCPPFAGQWLLPMTPVQPVETAEDAVKRYAREQFGVEVSADSFVDTVYMEDPDDRTQYITNIFRAQLRGGPMRFRADGDYDDARWLASAEVAQLWMPPSLRDPLVKIMTDPEYAPDTDWSTPEAQAVPLAERAGAPTASTLDAPAPDNRAAWDAIAKSYQDDFYGERYGTRLRWARGVYEDDLHLLEDVARKRAIVLGCGGGQDVVALAVMGAVTTGVDLSGEQILYARRFAAKHGADNASFVTGDVSDLSRFDDGSFDVGVSIYALQFVEDLGAVLSGAARVLRTGGVLGIAVPHPWNQIFSNTQPYFAQRPYFTALLPHIDWNWDDAKFAERGRLREWRRTITEWVDALVAAGFALERIVEPYQGDVSGHDADTFDLPRARLMPSVIIFKARKRPDAALDR
jgi:SAM-dependent methyltransferase/ADP-ribose pyrophosphatase YjhB (NUDIX family)